MMKAVEGRILAEVEDGIGTITFDNPVLGTIPQAQQESLNAIAQATATFNAGGTSGRGSAHATVDQAVVPANSNLIASATVSVTASPDGYTNAAFDAAGTAFDGVQISKLVLTDSDPNTDVLLDDVTAKTLSAADAPLRFSDATTAANNRCREVSQPSPARPARTTRSHKRRVLRKLAPAASVLHARYTPNRIVPRLRSQLRVLTCARECDRLSVRL